MMRENEKESVNISLEFDISLVHGFNLLVFIIRTRALAPVVELTKEKKGQLLENNRF